MSIHRLAIAPLNAPEEFRTLLESEIVRWGNVVEAAGIKPE